MQKLRRTWQMMSKDEKIYNLSDQSNFSEFSSRGFANSSYGIEEVSN